MGDLEAEMGLGAPGRESKVGNRASYSSGVTLAWLLGLSSSSWGVCSWVFLQRQGQHLERWSPYKLLGEGLLLSSASGCSRWSRDVCSWALRLEQGRLQLGPYTGAGMFAVGPFMSSPALCAI